MIGAVTTARKATAGGLAAFLGPLAALYLSTADITARGVVAAVLTGVIGGLGVYSTGNTAPYEPRHADSGEG